MWNQEYDVAILGSGLGAASAAFKFSKAGLKVIVLEKGAWPHRDADDWNAEKILLNSRYFAEDKIGVRQYEAPDFKPTSFNENVGGMSIFYGGAAFRLRENDFQTWPLSYKDFSSSYDAAEELLEVHGRAHQDPTEPERSGDYPFEPIQLNAPAVRIFEAATKLGYRPFQIPLAINFKNQSRNICIECHTCDGYPCKLDAKNDATTLLNKAMKHPTKPVVLTNVLVEKLEREAERIKSATLIDRKTGERISLKAKLFILAAGSLGSPGILLRSNWLHEFPHSRFVGKNLMRHCNMIVSYVFPFKTNPSAIFHKQIAITHFYEDLRQEYSTATGVIQDIYTPERKVVSAFAPKGFKFIAGLVSERIQSLLCVAEDEAQESNRIELDEKSDRFGVRLTRIHHEYSKADYARRDYLVEKARSVLRAAGGKVSRLMKIDSFSHAVGTLRFGESDKSGVLNPNCQFYGLKNLYALDGSFMPSSGGVNPSLSIVANSLRASDKILERREEWAA